jgi:hypothetical protein
LDANPLLELAQALELLLSQWRWGLLGRSDRRRRCRAGGC